MWCLGLIFGRIPESRPSVYHLQGGDGHMGKWDDEFGQKFDDDSNRAAINKEREVQRQRAIDDKQHFLWGKLKQAARDAVEEINLPRASDILHFQPEERISGDEFVISYTRAGEAREVKGNFHRNQHKVVISEPSGNKVDYTISANDKNELVFEGNGVVAPEDIVRKMLRSLLQ